MPRGGGGVRLVLGRVYFTPPGAPRSTAVGGPRGWPARALAGEGAHLGPAELYSRASMAATHSRTAASS
jgi:hypothetical protein